MQNNINFFINFLLNKTNISFIKPVFNSGNYLFYIYTSSLDNLRRFYFFPPFPPYSALLDPNFKKILFWLIKLKLSMML